jgi:leucyl-tRNA synthetase
VSFVFRWTCYDCYEVPTKDNLKTTQNHQKVADDIENFSSILRFHNLWFVSTNWLLKAAIPVLFWPLGCRYFPYAPHIAEELWSLLGNEGSIATVPFLFSNPNI